MERRTRKQIVYLLAKGVKVQDISDVLSVMGKEYPTSTIEKELKKLKDKHKACTNIELICRIIDGHKIIRKLPVSRFDV